MEINANSHNGDVISGIGLINSHSIPQFNESRNLNEMNCGVKNGDVSGSNFYVNSKTVSEANNCNSINS